MCCSKPQEVPAQRDPCILKSRLKPSPNHSYPHSQAAFTGSPITRRSAQLQRQQQLQSCYQVATQPLSIHFTTLLTKHMLSYGYPINYFVSTPDSKRYATLPLCDLDRRNQNPVVWCRPPEVPLAAHPRTLPQRGVSLQISGAAVPGLGGDPGSPDQGVYLATSGVRLCNCIG